MSEYIDCRSVKERPLPEGPFYKHPNAYVEGECYEGCCDKYHCPDCGTRWRFTWN
jgi:hypothetical protein